MQSTIEERCRQLGSSRNWLQKVKVVKEIKQFNPRFEEDFAQEKDYDIDRCLSQICPPPLLFCSRLKFCVACKPEPSRLAEGLDQPMKREESCSASMSWTRKNIYRAQ